jgi:hypothetical protein
VRCNAVFSGFMHLHLIVQFSYYTQVHLHLLRSILARCVSVRCGSCGFFGYVGEAYTPNSDTHVATGKMDRRS